MRFLKAFFLVGFLAASVICYGQRKAVLSDEKLNKYVQYFNKLDTETVKNYVDNAHAAEWMAAQIPLFECPDSAIESSYYYRWWTYRKHLTQTPDGFITTEFIIPESWGGLYNTMSDAIGHQINEGRWLKDKKYMTDYANFWLYVDPKTPKPHLHNFSNWLESAVYSLYLVDLDKPFIAKALPVMNNDYKQWEAEKQLPNHLFWQFDVRDAMEESISGSRKDKNARPTLNSYLYGDADALAKMSQILGVDSLQKKYTVKASELKQLVQTNLWDDKDHFFKAFEDKTKTLCPSREVLGYIPWYFNLPDDNAKYASAWDELTDDKGFNAPWGITTAERRAPAFRTHGTGHGCEWDGAVWPFATTQTLKGLGNLLMNYKNHNNMSSAVFYDQLHKYAVSFVRRGEPYIGEYQDEKNGKWLKGDNPRSSYYNHSGFADLVISDLVGLKPREDDMLDIFPLIPNGKWNWFCLQDVVYHGHAITMVWDRDGSRYHKGTGFTVYSDGKQLYHGKDIAHVTVALK